ncbi:helix-turn-helix domain-containing protein [Halalkalibacterium halodurans]|uniref:helix-turn-helix domain-containing protein n=1 Tax=Halalkalibacterium halodurans TaxID=86665 RepID=UPI0010FE1E94|nr:helix-turn-helix transcriptional regulator [Halalkalibacterium halodurans]
MKERKLNSFGAKLKKLRLEKGYSLQQLAKLSNVNASYIHRLEQGNRNRPSFTIIMQLAEALKVDVIELIGNELKKNKQSVTMEELFYSNEIIYKGKTLTSDAKEVLLLILEEILDSEWTSHTMLEELKQVGEAITELKEVI